MPPYTILDIIFIFLNKKHDRKILLLADIIALTCVTSAKLLLSCLTLCNTRDYSPPGSSVHGILQTRILE